MKVVIVYTFDIQPWGYKRNMQHVLRLEFPFNAVYWREAQIYVRHFLGIGVIHWSLGCVHLKVSIYVNLPTVASRQQQQQKHWYFMCKQYCLLISLTSSWSIVSKFRLWSQVIKLWLEQRYHSCIRYRQNKNNFFFVMSEKLTIQGNTKDYWSWSRTIVSLYM